MPTAINWRSGEVKFNHDHLKAEMSDKPVGKALEWGIGQEHVKFGDSHLIPADTWMWSWADGLWLLAHRLALDLCQAREASGQAVLCTYHDSMGTALAFAFGVMQMRDLNTKA